MENLNKDEQIDNLNKNEIEEKIIEIIDYLRPFLANDGGNIEFVKYEDNIVYIKMLGACANCHMLDFTLKEGIEAALISEIPEIKKVVTVDNLF